MNNQQSTMGLIIAGCSSGVGKTTVSLALLSFLSRKGKQVQSFKVGPDYIDPMFHTAITGLPCRNLDPVLTSPAYIQSCFANHAGKGDYALVEGVMGLFDGISKEQDSEIVRDFASTAHIARLLDLPVVLVIDCSKLSGSVAAIAHGYCTLEPRVKIAGVVLNRVGSDRHLTLLQEALEPLNLPILGVLRRTEEIAIPDRHLGLVPTAELDTIEELTSRLAEIAATSFDWEKLLPLLKRDFPARFDLEKGQSQQLPPAPTSPRSAGKMPALRGGVSKSVRIAWACDRAFSFYYQDNLDLLKQLGAELIPWSPLQDPELPEKTQGIYLGGGFPEVFAEELANNYSGLKAVKKAIAQLTPTYAECGGLMYLCEEIIDFNQVAWSMVGILPTKAIMSSRLTLGYRQAIALQNSSLLETGQVICGHEFHRSQLTTDPQNPLLQTHNYSHTKQKYHEGWQLGQLHASYLHAHFAQYQDYLERFLGCCKENINL